MLAQMRRRLTFANAVSMIALFIALGAGAYAAGLAPDSVRSKHIVNGQVKEPDLAAPEPWNEVGDADGPDFGAGTGWGCGIPAVSNYDSNHNSAAFYRDPYGTVHLKGLLKTNGSTCYLFFELPPGYRPAKRSIFNVRSSNGTMRINVEGPNEPALGNVPGTVAAESTLDSGLWFSLDGITFRCSPSGQNGCP